MQNDLCAQELVSTSWLHSAWAACSQYNNRNMFMMNIVIVKMSEYIAIRSYRSALANAKLYNFATVIILLCYAHISGLY